jgi:hypothetical protein
MRVPIILAGAFAALAVSALPATALADSCTLAKLAWFAGTWRDAANPQGSEERWVLAPGGVLMGTSWVFPAGGKAGFAEIMTVRSEGDAINMVLRHFDNALRGAWEERDAPMVFLATDCDAGRAVFDGIGARTGERLTYERNQQGLKITGDFVHDGKPSRVQWQMVRAP